MAASLIRDLLGEIVYNQCFEYNKNEGQERVEATRCSELILIMTDPGLDCEISTVKLKDKLQTPETYRTVCFSAPSAIEI